MELRVMEENSEKRVILPLPVEELAEMDWLGPKIA